MRKNSGSISEQVHEIELLQQRFLAERLKKRQLNLQQARALNFIAANPGTMQKKLAHYLDKPEATVTNILKALEQKDYITREIPDENERQKLLYLSSKGQTTAKEINQIFQEMEQKISDYLTTEEQSILQSLLLKTKNSLL